MPRASKRIKIESDEDSDEGPESEPPFASPALSDASLRMSYRIARGEQGVLTFEPYKSILLPHWRFKTGRIAEKSSQVLYRAFRQYLVAGDFVGADMARKFIQMGMTRAKRYANHAGGKKYDYSGADGQRTELPKSAAHQGREEKLAASNIFREVWKLCTADEGYLELKEEFVGEQKAWEKEGKKDKRQVDEGGIDQKKIKTEVPHES